LADPRIGAVVHATPGRIRLRVARGYRVPATYHEIESLLRMLPGVELVEVTPNTGSILVKYNSATLDIEHLLRMGSELGWFPGAPLGARSAAPFGARQAPFNGLLTDGWPGVDKVRLAKGVALIGVAGLGGLAGPAFGVSARIASIIASAAFLAAQRGLERLGTKQVTPSPNWRQVISVR
jgi:copper chaperone CopZ